MPRTIVDIPGEQVDALDRLRAQQHVTRATLIREAIARYDGRVRHQPAD